MEESSFSDADDDIGTVEVTSSPGRDQLLPLLECPVCFDLPLPPIRTCQQGHIICSDCCPKLSACPLCQNPIGIGRNFFAEDFISKSTMRCKYRIDGCRGILIGSAIKEHIKQCQFRPLGCHYCKKKVSYREFERHLLSDHQVSRWDINDNGVRILQESKQRSNIGDNIVPDNTRLIYGFLFKSLLASITVSWIIDQWIEIP